MTMWAPVFSDSDSAPPSLFQSWLGISGLSSWELLASLGKIGKVETQK